MEGFSLRSRAVVFALSAGAIAFVLALVATSAGQSDSAGATRALVAAIVCATMCWAYAERNIATTAGAIDAAINRLALAANGDLQSPLPREIHDQVPPLADAMEGLFRQLHSHIENVQRLAMFDQVTGLSNRTHFRRNVERVLVGMPPSNEAALFFIDLDRFKRVNDTLGHAAGDQLLAMVGNRLRAVADRFSPGGGDDLPLIGRLSGDEFTMFFTRLDVPGDALRIGRAILFALSEPFDIVDQEVSIGASIGIAMRPDHGVTLTDLMRAADVAMYHAKSEGRGRAEPFTERLAATLVERAQLETELRSAVNARQFALVFQPQVALHDGRIVAAEALLRWNHPDGELRLPDSFLDRAEETGLIVEIGDWVVAAVADTIARWGRLGLEQRLAINVSRRQLDHASFFRKLRAAMRDANAPARLLELEISETLAMNFAEETNAAIIALRADGATVAVDNFGTGYSNLSRLRDLPIDRVKLDRSLVERVADDAHAQSVIQAVVRLVHSMGFEAVAEGVETAEQVDVLRVIGCTVIQGYIVAEPMAEDRFLVWAHDTRKHVESVKRTA